jgi:hypothetical protein
MIAIKMVPVMLDANCNANLKIGDNERSSFQRASEAGGSKMGCGPNLRIETHAGWYLLAPRL